MKNDLLYCLLLLSEKMRRHISSYYQCEEIEPQKMIKEIICSHKKQDLSEDEYYAIQWFLWRSRGGVLLERENADVYWGKMRSGLVQLAQRGWVYALRNERNERYFYCPREIRKTWLLSKWSNYKFSSFFQGQMRPIHEPSIGIGQAFFHFLVSLDAEPWSRSKSGRYPKRQAQKIDIELDLPSEPIQETTWGTRKDLPPWISLFFEMAHRFQLIQITDQKIKVAPSKLASWLYQDWEEMLHQLYYMLRALWSEYHPEMDGDWLLLEICVGKDWIALDDIMNFKAQMIGRRLQEDEKRRLYQLVTLLDVCGWIELGQWECGKIGVRFKKISPKEGALRLYIQNSLEIFIPYHFPLKYRYQLAQMADFMGGDQWLTYLFTPSSLRRAKQYGHQLEDVIQFLQEHSDGKVSEWVIKQLTHDWNQDESFIIEEMFFIQAPSSEALEELMKALDMRRIRRFSETSAGLPKTDWIKDQLDKFKGIRCQLPAAEPFFKIGKVENTRSLLNKSTMINQIPSLEKWFPFIHQIPILWTSGMRAYQMEMLQEIIRRSIHYSLPLQIEHNGEIFQMHPIALQSKNGQLMVIGLEDQQPIPLHQIDRIQMIIPTITSRRSISPSFPK